MDKARARSKFKSFYPERTLVSLTVLMIAGVRGTGRASWTDSHQRSPDRRVRIRSESPFYTERTLISPLPLWPGGEGLAVAGGLSCGIFGASIAPVNRSSCSGSAQDSPCVNLHHRSKRGGLSLLTDGNAHHSERWHMNARPDPLQERTPRFA